MTTSKKVVRRSAKPSWESLVVLLDEARREKDALDKRIKELQLQVLDKFGDEKTVTVDADDGRTLKATRVQNVRVTIDDQALKSVVAPPLWNKITVRTLDKTKVEAFIGSGELDPAVVAQCSTETPSSPFIKITDRG